MIRFFGEHPTAASALIVFSEQGGLTWQGPPYRFSGLLSRSSVEGGLWSGVIEKDRTNRLLPLAELTHEKQQVRAANDLGLRFMDTLERGISVSFPP